jgi:hypothetical protein
MSVEALCVLRLKDPFYFNKIKMFVFGAENANHKFVFDLSLKLITIQKGDFEVESNSRVCRVVFGQVQAMIGLIALSGSFLSGVGCQRPEQSSQVANNGEVVQNPYEDPTVVKLSINGGGTCTGTLMQENRFRFVLTAAHCVYENPNSQKLLSPATIKVDINGTNYQAARIVPHPLYRGEAGYDVAMIFLDQSAAFPKVRVVGAPPKVGDKVKVDGFGVFAMSYVVDDDDGDGVNNRFDYCPNTPDYERAQIDSKGCSFSQTPENFSYREPIGDHRSGIRRSGWNEIGEVTGDRISLRKTFYNGRTQVNGTQVASGDSGGPLIDTQGRVIGVVSMAEWRGQSADTLRASLYANITGACNREFIRTGTASGCGR